jgi:hypothetical protein
MTGGHITLASGPAFSLHKGALRGVKPAGLPGKDPAPEEIRKKYIFSIWTGPLKSNQSVGSTLFPEVVCRQKRCSIEYFHA